MDIGQTTAVKVVLLATSTAFLIVLGSTAYRNNFQGEWRQHQRRYKQLLIQTAGDEAAQRVAGRFVVEFKQIYLADLGTIDRCITCHLGVENPAMTDTEPPLRTHPGDLLVRHPIEQFGCVICHRGQGRAVGREAAHGWRDDGAVFPHAEAALLRRDLVYTSCSRCHYENDLFGWTEDRYAPRGPFETLNAAELEASLLGGGPPVPNWIVGGKELVVQSGCLGCHRYRGRGGTLGPDITFVGDKTVRDFDFKHVRGERTVYQWLFEHFTRPAEVTPGTIMPDMKLSDEQARGLTKYMLSLHRKSLPVSYIPTPLRPDGESVSGAQLYGMFCSACHGASGHGNGPAAPALKVRPRDLRNEPFRYVSTLNGVPTHDDLMHTIRSGRRFGEMLASDPITESEIAALADYVRELNRLGWIERLTRDFSGDDEITTAEILEIALERVTPGEPITVSPPPQDFRPDQETGATLYLANCAACHGPSGRGDGMNRPKDAQGNPIEVRDLTSGEFRGGSEPEELFKRIRCGMPGTPMPAQAALTVPEIWQLVYYVQLLVE